MEEGGSRCEFSLALRKQQQQQQKGGHVWNPSHEGEAQRLRPAWPRPSASVTHTHTVASPCMGRTRGGGACAAKCALRCHEAGAARASHSCRTKERGGDLTENPPSPGLSNGALWSNDEILVSYLLQVTPGTAVFGGRL